MNVHHARSRTPTSQAARPNTSAQHCVDKRHFTWCEWKHEYCAVPVVATLCRFTCGLCIVSDQLPAAVAHVAGTAFHQWLTRTTTASAQQLANIARPVCSLPRPLTALFSAESNDSLRILRTSGGGMRLRASHAVAYGWTQQIRFPFRPMSHRHIGTCAVVGSSSRALDQELGSEIEQADWVVRVNNAPVPSQLRAHLGTRT